MYPTSRLARALIVTVILAVSVVAGYFATQLRFDTSLEVYFLESDKDLAAYHDFLDVFSTDQMVVMAWEDKDLWTPEGMAALHRFTEEVEEIDDVREARSLATASEVEAEPGLLMVTPLWDPDADEPPDLKALKERVLADDMFVGALINEAGDVPAIIVTVEHRLEDTAYKIELAAKLRALGERITAERGGHVAVAGPPALDDAFFRYVRGDLMIIFPLMVLAIVLVVLFLFRTVRALMLPASVVLISCLWVTGIMGALGIGITVVHNIIYPLILGLGIASSIHVTSRAVLLRGLGKSPEEAAQQALHALFAPCFYTTLTTVGGLMSLWVGTLKPVREFGALSAGGAVMALVLTYALGPLLLPYLPKPKPSPEIASDEPVGGGARGALDGVLLRLSLLAERRAGVVVLVSVIALAASLAGLPRLKTGANVLEYFHKGERVRTDVEFVDAHLAGTTTLEVYIETDSTDGVKDPAVLASMVAIQEWMEELDGIGTTVSLADFVSELRQAQRGGEEVERRVPDTRAEVSQLLLMLDDPTELERMADFQFQRARITAPVQLSKVTQLTKNIPELEVRLEKEFGPLGVKASATGQSRLIHNMERYLLETMVRSLGLAFLLVSVFMAFALRSVKLGLFSMIPNIVPIGFTLGLMSWTGVRLDPGTATTGAVALGLVVDDTLHFLHQFREWAGKEGVSLAEATERTLRVTGRALVMTTAILVTAFASMLVASFTPNNNFGMLSAITIGLALVADLIVLPAAIALIKPRF
ncbi:MAG: RND family transporter [Deltaproteobacteria bacterium]|nr:RND family transporter [Deltaproteobacteria bacterium]